MATKDKTFRDMLDVFKLDTSRREEIEYIDIDKIDSDARNFYELSGLDALAANIELCGLQQPIRVRTSTKKPSRVVIVSGHRRVAALRMLVEEGKEGFRDVACIREDTPKSWAMQELRLIYANSDTRKMSSADIAKQAERVQELLYQLKEEGVEFPGRMRDHVAEACQISKSKLARLKVIRESLIPALHKDWENKSFSDQAAYALARMPELMQQVFADKPGKHEFGGEQCEKILEARGSYANPQPNRYNGAPCKNCDNGDNFLLHDVRERYGYDLCKGKRCCKSCASRHNCKFICSSAAKEKADRDAAQAERQANDEADRRKKSDEILEEAEVFWGRVNALCIQSGADLQAVAKKLIPYSYQSSTIPKIVDKTFDGMLYSGHELGLDLVKNLTDTCTMLGCSADALLGLPSSSGQARERAEWVPLDVQKNKWACDHCGYVEWADQYPAEDGYLYCAGCGRDMRKEALHESD